jgi:hypothetical protein
VSSADTPARCKNTRPPVVVDPVGDQHRLTSGVVVHLEVGGVNEQVVELDLREVAGAPGGELLLGHELAQ